MRRLSIPLLAAVSLFSLSYISLADYRQNVAGSDVQNFKATVDASSRQVPSTVENFQARTSNIAAVASGQPIDGVATAIGVQVTRPYSIPEATWRFASATGGIVNTTTAVTLNGAGAAGIKNYINSMQIQTDTLGAATELAIRDGAAGTVIWRTKLQTTALPLTTINFEPPLSGTAATLMEVVTLTAAVSGGVFVNAQGHQAP
jgi:hypothetical protein